MSPSDDSPRLYDDRALGSVLFSVAFPLGVIGVGYLIARSTA